MNGIPVTVVIPCRNEAKHIERCLQGVLAFVPPPGGFEVIIADGMSEDGTRDILARISSEDPRVMVLDNHARTIPCGLNLAIRQSRGDVIVRVDAHTEYAPDYIIESLRVLDETGADNVGGPTLTRAGPYLQRAIAAASHSRFAAGSGRHHLPDYEGPVDTVSYGCFVRRRLLDVGLYDEELARAEDSELNLRLRLSGGTIWQSPRIRSWYAPRDSLSSLFMQHFQYGYWKFRVIQKHRRIPSIRNMVPALFVLTLAASSAAAAIVPGAYIGVVALGSAYLLALTVSSTVTAQHSNWSFLPILYMVFPCYHLGHGLGFLFGVWDFAVCHRKQGRCTALTRT